MTVEEAKRIEPGMRLLIEDHFVMDPDDSVEEFLGTAQVVSKIDATGDDVWVYFDGVPQPFSNEEIVGVFIDKLPDFNANNVTTLFE